MSEEKAPAPPADLTGESGPRRGPDLHTATSTGSGASSHHVRTLRVACGLVMLTYVFLHLTNHALGNISLELMQESQVWLVGFFRKVPGTILLGGAALIHFSLALWAVYLKRRFTMPLWEATQLFLGFLIPFLLIEHVVAARMARELYGAESDYAFIIWQMQKRGWTYAVQVVLLIVAWSHGCMGVHYWLRFRSWYPKFVRPFAAVAFILPILALLGFLQAVREVARLEENPRWQRAFKANEATIGEDGAARLAQLELDILIVLLLCGVLLYAARVARRVIEHRKGLLQVLISPNNVVTIRPGLTVLEVSRAAGIPHASVCGGRSRCSTCRVRVNRGLDDLPPPAANEARILARIGAAHNVRLACQIRPTHDIAVTPLFPVSPRVEEVRNAHDYDSGKEMEIVVMFADLRGFTSASEHRLPYDTVFLLNRYFQAMGMVIHSCNGHVDKFIGDGIMALFGLEEDLVRATTNAMRAAREMSLQLDRLNAELRQDLQNPLKIGIGIHSGIAIVGKFGWGNARTLTAIGDTVNTASRIEGLTKRFDCELLVSAAAAQVIGAQFGGCERYETEVRGRKDKIEVVIVPSARDLKIIDTKL